MATNGRDKLAWILAIPCLLDKTILSLRVDQFTNDNTMEETIAMSDRLGHCTNNLIMVVDEIEEFIIHINILSYTLTP